MKKNIIHALLLAAAIFVLTAASSCDDPYIQGPAQTGSSLVR